VANEPNRAFLLIATNFFCNTPKLSEFNEKSTSGEFTAQGIYLLPFCSGIIHDASFLSSAKMSGNLLNTGADRDWLLLATAPGDVALPVSVSFIKSYFHTTAYSIE
jgi:hypothetical protein